MKTEVSHYDRCEIGHPDHTYDFLLTSFKKLIQRRRQDRNRQEIEAHLGGGNLPALAAAKGKGKGKGKGICFKFRDTGRCDNKDCKYSHGENAAPA